MLSILLLLGRLPGHAQTTTSSGKPSSVSFPKGDKAPAENFTGMVWVNTLVPDEAINNCSRDVLSYQPRELVTILALSAMSGVAPQLQAHIGTGMNIRLTQAQAEAAFQAIDETVSKHQGNLARQTRAKVLAAKN